MTPAAGRHRPAWRWAIWLRLLTAGLLGAAVLGWAVSPEQLLTAGAGADPLWLGAATALLPLSLATQWWRWRVLARAGVPGIAGGDVLRSLLAGFGLGLLTPGRLGELGRGVALPGHRRAATSLAAADRLISAAVTLAAGALGGAWIVGGALAVAAVATALVLASLAVGRARLEGLRRRAWVRAVLEPLLGLPSRVWRCNAAGAVFFNIIFWTQFYCLLAAGQALPPGTAAAIPAVFALKTLLPVSFMDLGVREGAAVLVLVPLGVSAPAAVNAALGLFALNVLLPGAAGLLYLGLAHGLSHPRPLHRPGIETAHVC